mmetsp:Transcript_54685/g.116836  ORF Transcript_54685/g.116836 Transcript_54685/m.116836 type:complete len:446 (-) Transcript_54685:279-1616(-)|eukprot:CAMPEP_0206476560 /NCGR_PEP_ID=MMETSP0324_2-20121206/34800_1 /ASSEMBLY_ACC=CAM_ASM_000836 /TAXON_ID=2866 /ORGANISM="Crypthecodinium cohnii, Strain Seligo" /LENGTH=445 /DNA_ID=CAMNT_0053952237 /DNA_START=374 /DNA_END=1711 /DNA_ORIENTATION=+
MSMSDSAHLLRDTDEGLEAFASTSANDVVVAAGRRGWARRFICSAAILLVAVVLLFAGGRFVGKGQNLFSFNSAEDASALYSLRLGRQTYRLRAPVKWEVRDISARAKANCALQANLILIQLTRFGSRTGKAVWNCRPDARRNYASNVSCSNNLVGIYTATLRAISAFENIFSNCDAFHYGDDYSCGASVTRIMAEIGTMTTAAASLDTTCSPWPAPKETHFPDFSTMTVKQQDLWRLDKVDCVDEVWQTGVKIGQVTTGILGFEANCKDAEFEGCAPLDPPRTCYEKIKNFTLEDKMPCTRDNACDSSDPNWLCLKKMKACRLAEVRAPISCAGQMMNVVSNSWNGASWLASATGRCAPKSTPLPQCLRAVLRIPAILLAFSQSAMNIHLECGKGNKEAEYINYVSVLDTLQDKKEDSELNMEKIQELKAKLDSLDMKDPYPEG